MSRAARHVAILVTVALCGCLAAFGGWRFARASAPVNGPIVLISVDSLRPDHLAAYGYGAGKTPAIDALAADGTVFERAYSHSPQTLPAHASLLTGRLPFETGVRDVAGYALPGSVRTIAEILRDRGYKTGGVVSSFLLRKETGLSRGFTFFDDAIPLADQTSDRWLMRDGAESEELAEHWLESIGTSRAFLFLHLAEPHGPRTPADTPQVTVSYDGAIAQADDVVGRVVRYLKSHQLYDRSTILLVSDHGEGLGDHGEQGHGLLLNEEALRVPLIVKRPAGESATRRVGDRVQLIDIVPTILDLAKAPDPGGLRGRSLTSYFSGDSADEVSTIYAESLYGNYRFGWAPLKSLVRGHYQLLESGAETRLLDLDVPPGERDNLAEKLPEITADLQGELAEYRESESPLQPSPVTETDRDRYEALGYVGVPGTIPTPDTSQVDSMSRVEFVERYRAAIQQGRVNDLKSALDSYRLLTREEPTMADVWLHMARIAARNERHDLAVDAFRYVLDLNPDGAAGHLGAAASYLRLRKLDEAVLHAEAVRDSSGVDSVQKAQAHELLARVFLDRKERERALAEADAAEAADPNRPVRAFIEGRMALDDARYEDAVEAFDRALHAAVEAGRPPLADVRVFAADALAHTQQTERAEALLTAELTAFPANQRARSALQALYRASGRAREAAALAKR